MPDCTAVQKFVCKLLKIETGFNVNYSLPDMEFVQKLTTLDFQVKKFTQSILPNFNSFSKKKTQKMSENGEIYTAGKNFTLPPALTGWTNSTSGLKSKPLDYGVWQGHASISRSLLN